MAPQQKPRLLSTTEHASDVGVVRLWISGGDLHVDNDLERVAAALEYHPELAQEVVSQRPMRAPLILQVAFGRYGIATVSLQTAIRREFIRTNGNGANADLLFRSTLRLEGAHSEELKREMQGLIADHDVKSAMVDGASRAEPPDAAASKSGIARIAAEDPAVGRLYSRFVDAPSEAAAQLLMEVNQDRAKFDDHVRRLSQFIEYESRSTQAFVRAVNALKGRGAVNVKLAVAEALQWAAAPDIEAVTNAASQIAMVDDVTHTFHRSESDAMRALHPSKSDERLAQIIPLLAEIVSQPDVARTLVMAAHGVESDAAGRTRLRELMECLLSEAYDEATRVRVRTVMVAGTSSMLEQSARLEPGPERNAAGDVAGTYLGCAARVASDAVKADDASAAAVAKKMKSRVDAIKTILPGPAKTGLAVGQFLFDSKPRARKHDPAWTSVDLDTLLNTVYGAVHQRPPGHEESSAVRQYENDYMDWRREPAQAFHNQVGEN